MPLSSPERAPELLGVGGEKVRGGVGERSLYWRKTRAVGGQRDPQGERQGELLGRGGWGGGTGEGAGDDS